MIGLGRRSVPRGISAKKSQRFDEKSILSTGPLRNFSIFFPTFGPPCQGLAMALNTCSQAKGSTQVSESWADRTLRMGRVAARGSMGGSMGLYFSS